MSEPGRRSRRVVIESASPQSADSINSIYRFRKVPCVDICLSCLSLNNHVSPQQERLWCGQFKQFGRLEIDGGPFTQAPGCPPCHCRPVRSCWCLGAPVERTADPRDRSRLRHQLGALS
jgi:hypothetical protein